VILDETKKNLFYVPEGFAHGFLVLSEYAEFVYKCTDIYDPASEGGILWNDPTIGIEWPELDIPYKTSDKDKKQLSFNEQSFSWFEQY
ncbi:MAG: dTDP-4-dehydrorhamnose 3,5-epimerase family protein, partial [Solobacterium sp.]|nr:dTDP-4-dehydrorhamnose 3,5-epimerase family protein [Solobacterium sp.]